MRALVALTLLSVLAACGGTSKGTLQGTFTSGNRAGMAEARLVLTPLDGDGGDITATTNARGGFRLADVQKGLYRLSLHYEIADVFDCAVPYTVEIQAGKTLVRKLTVPIVDVQPSGKARLPKGKTTTCRTLSDPLQSYLCEAAVIRSSCMHCRRGTATARLVTSKFAACGSGHAATPT